MFRLKGIEIIGVHNQDTDDLYLIPLAHFFDRTRYHTRNYETRGGADQRYMPMEHFVKRPGLAKI